MARLHGVTHSLGVLQVLLKTLSCLSSVLVLLSRFTRKIDRVCGPRKLSEIFLDNCRCLFKLKAPVWLWNYSCSPSNPYMSTSQRPVRKVPILISPITLTFACHTDRDEWLLTESELSYSLSEITKEQTFSGLACSDVRFEWWHTNCTQRQSRDNISPDY